MRDEKRRRRAKVWVSSISFVTSGENDPSEDQARTISVVQQNAMIVNSFRDDRSTRSRDRTGKGI